MRAAGIRVCCGGILGMGEGVEDHAAMLCTLANLPAHPESVPINMLVCVDGTPLAGRAPLDPLDFVKTIAVARILMPASYVRLSAGRGSDERRATNALLPGGCEFDFFFGEKLLTTPNPAMHADQRLFQKQVCGRRWPTTSGLLHECQAPRPSTRTVSAA